ncbi:MAG: cellobiose phosphorylase, partial [Acetatifactor sp.]|nr:cellobiose phosphorylase [Acetatifactor sp.]
MSHGDFFLSGDRFIIENYDRQPAFSSFLPGLAGVKGIPVWSFYTNRGQGINSFGIHNKGNAMMEFNSANTAYENTPVKGFRTFVRLGGQFFEPFCSYDKSAVRRMEIEKNAVAVIEESHGLRITVRYFVLPHENIGALVRHVTVENLGEEREIELLDGMPQIIVYGITNGQYKEMSNLFKSWVDIKNLEGHAPIYTMRASSDDSAEVSEIEGGYYYCCAMEGALQPVLYDKSVIFEQDSAMLKPVVFMEEGLAGVLEKSQCFANKVPCAFVAVKRKLGRGEQLSFAAYAGYTASAELLNRKTQKFCQAGYVEEKIKEARALAESFTKDVWTQSADPLFDQYIQQCYLDNFLRGGYPFIFGQGEDKKVIHLFSRKHGDPERDYNFFSIAGEYYSQGNGNYRDVCQNRRNDVFFCPETGDFNVRQFYNLVQMDGYNPLEIRPSTFVISEAAQGKAGEILSSYVETGRERLEEVLRKPFTPGQITNAIAAHGLALRGDEEKLVEELLGVSKQQQEAGFGEGYWSDHWDYNLDLIENYLLIYPEKKKELIFGDHNYRYYNSIGVVRPRQDTYVLSKGKVRQYGSMAHCEEKLALPGFHEGGTNWLKDREGREVTTTLFGKLMTLAVNKFALLDSCGLGVEMEGGKPGWNDAMNGLPGLFGSSMPETLELKRLVEFLLEAVQECPEEEETELCRELHDFMYDIELVLEQESDDFTYWDQVAGLRERFREKTKLCVSGEAVYVTFRELKRILEAFAQKLHRAVEKALELGGGIMPTYFTYEAKEY